MKKSALILSLLFAVLLLAWCEERETPCVLPDCGVIDDCTCENGCLPKENCFNDIDTKRDEDQNSYFSAWGVEPFWNFTLKDDTLVLTTPWIESDKEATYPVNVMNSGNEILFEGEWVNWKIIKTDCFDDSAGFLHEYYTEIDYGLEFDTRGCADKVITYNVKNIIPWDSVDNLIVMKVPEGQDLSFILSWWATSVRGTIYYEDGDFVLYPEKKVMMNVDYMNPYDNTNQTYSFSLYNWKLDENSPILTKLKSDPEFMQQLADRYEVLIQLQVVWVNHYAWPMSEYVNYISADSYEILPYPEYNYQPDL